MLIPRETAGENSRQFDKNRYTFAKLVCCQNLNFQKIFFINEIDKYNLILKYLLIRHIVIDTISSKRPKCDSYWKFSYVNVLDSVMKIVIVE